MESQRRQKIIFLPWLRDRRLPSRPNSLIFCQDSGESEAMTIQKIALMGQPVLRRPARPVTDFEDQELQHLIADMSDTMHEAPGVGLAAPQIFAGRRVIVFRVPSERGNGEAFPETVLINPELEPLDDRLSLGWEGCLWQRQRWRMSPCQPW